MRNIGPFGLENRIFAGLCGLGALLVSLIIFGWGFFGSLIFGVIVAIIALLWLMMSAGNSDSKMSQSGNASASSRATPASAQNANSDHDAAATASPETTPDVGMASEKTAASATPADLAATDTNTDSSSATPAAKVKSSTTLSGEDELAARKGNWKYEAPAAQAEAPKPAAQKPAVKKAPAKDAAAKKAAAPADKSVAAAPDSPGEKPEMLTAARAGGADDLKQIKGVGPKMETMLNEMGVYHFDQIAGWSADEVSWVDQNLKGFKGRVSRDNWVDQSATLAAGGETEFSKKVGKGGVY